MGVKSGAVLMYGCPRNPSRRSAGGVGGPWGLRDVGEGELPALVTEPVFTGSRTERFAPSRGRPARPRPGRCCHTSNQVHEDVEGPEETGVITSTVSRRPLPKAREGRVATGPAEGCRRVAWRTATASCRSSVREKISPLRTPSRSPRTKANVAVEDRRAAGRCRPSAPLTLGTD